MKALAKILVLGSLALSLQAACIGSSSFSTCTDSSGNSYTVTRFGNTTIVNGSAVNGNTWSQTSQTFGNTTYTNGTAANGNSWNQTTTKYGNIVTTYGTDSHGNSFSDSWIVD